MNIQIENITKKYGKYTALNNFSVTLSNGVYGLLGANGAGKSTLINIIVGLLRQNNGYKIQRIYLVLAILLLVTLNEIIKNIKK